MENKNSRIAIGEKPCKQSKESEEKVHILAKSGSGSLEKLKRMHIPLPQKELSKNYGWLLQTMGKSKSNVRLFRNSPYCNLSTPFKKEIIHALKHDKHYKPNACLSGDKLPFEPETEEIGSKITVTHKMYIKKGSQQYTVHPETHQISLELSECMQRGCLSMHRMKIKIQKYAAQLLSDYKSNQENYEQNIIGFRIKNSSALSAQQQQTINYLLSVDKLEPFRYMKPGGQYQLELQTVCYDPRALEPQQISLKNFQILECLGTGGFSSVYLCRGLFNNCYYAMKLIDKTFILQTQRESIVINQRHILAQLAGHGECGTGHIPDQRLQKQTINEGSIPSKNKACSFFTQMYFAFETCNHFVFVLEYCPGGELFHRLKSVRNMPEDLARFYFLQILVALDYIHSKGVLYRDLKPQNLLIDAEGHIKIADFGLSKPVVQVKDLCHSFCGSPEYMAPEMLSRSGHNMLLDYYCLGALLYELVVGVPPFYSDNRQEIYDSIMSSELAYPDNISTQLISLLNGLLQKQPKMRLGSICGIKEVMAHPWVRKNCVYKILNRELVPPYVPNLMKFNFELEQQEAGKGLAAVRDKLAQDYKAHSFQSYFSESFKYCNRAQLPNKPVKIAKNHKKENKNPHVLQLSRSPNNKNRSLPKKSEERKQRGEKKTHLSTLSLCIKPRQVRHKPLLSKQTSKQRPTGSQSKQNKKYRINKNLIHSKEPINHKSKIRIKAMIRTNRNTFGMNCAHTESHQKYTKIL